jgi:7tm Odorant receptor
MSSDWLKVLEKPIKYLKFSGMWTHKEIPKYRIILTAVAHLICVELFLILEIIYLFTVDNLEDFSLAFLMIPTFISCCMRSLNFVVKKNKIEKFLRSFQELVEHENWIELQNGLKLKQRMSKIDKMFKVHLITSLFGMVSLYIASALSHSMSVPMWFPWDYKNNEWLFWLSHSYQNISGFMFSPINTVSD